MKYTNINHKIIKDISIVPLRINETTLFTKNDLPILIETANKNGLVFLGADGFILSNGHLVPDLNWIIDSSLTTTLNEQELIIYIKRINNYLQEAPENLLFECFFSCT